MNWQQFTTWIISINWLLSTGVSDDDIANVTLPTGVPVQLELDENLKPVKPRQLLGDQAKIQAAIKKVEDQGKAKQATWPRAHTLPLLPAAWITTSGE